MEKKCTKCKEVKGPREFSPGSSWCKECRRQDYHQREDKREKLKKAGKRSKYLDIRKVKPQTAKSLEKEQWIRFCEVFRSMNLDSNLLALYDFLQSTGARVQEALRLLWSDFNFEAGTVKLAILKTQGYRDALPDPFYIEFVRPDLLKKIAEVPTRLETTFPFSYRVVYNTFRKVVERAGLESRLSPHVLRSVYTSRANRIVGSNLRELFILTRHVSKKEAIDHYVRIEQDRRLEIMKQMWEKEVVLWR